VRPTASSSGYCGCLSNNRCPSAGKPNSILNATSHGLSQVCFKEEANAAAREKIVGWYHTGPRIREADLDISALLGNYCENPLLVICEVEVRCRVEAAAGPA
jgi:ribosomal protein S14